ncbi:3-oxoacyl-[acyl-carrier-protein] reductase FabG [Streptomyces sp. ADI96-02]|uniref:SDR family oxidoreductase n=1 Tax=unclassified Streptomyces TaxID=2593676 RepID=UPI000F54C6AF|nr:SDR family oxidoreductase [Streptomyces sp. ADI96-02]RPK54182.1 3-oxoacyl-[acyl-carrier-protein] reductase FabG [Streptomyces sp. ADI96-02]
MDSLAGKVALVTGASRGIGRGIARRLARDGALVAVHYGTREPAALEVVDAIRKDGGRAFAVGAPLGVEGDAEALYGGFAAGMAAEGESPVLDILVNNAGVSGSGRIGAASSENFDRMFAVNVKAPLFLIQRGLELLRDDGRIVNISSAAARIAFPESVTYAMTKGAVETMTRALAKEVAGRGITVNAVVPGFVATDMNAGRRRTPEAAAALAAHSVFGRIGSPADIADVVAFLASADARWVTGQCVDATGGTGL